MLKKEAFSILGKANCREKNVPMPIAQNDHQDQGLPFVAIFLASSLFRLPTPTIREITTEGRMVICQILMNASPMGFKTEQRSPKNRPTRMPRKNPSSIQ